MPFHAKTYEVMIACPSDMEANAEIVRKAIASWNDSHAKRMGLVLLPISWRTHAAPAAGDRPQNIINRQVLARADILVALFGTRIGSPTDKFASGTEEEIQRHQDDGKPVMVYFSRVPVDPHLVQAEQLDGVRHFRQRFGAHALHGEFVDGSELLRSLERDLLRVIEQLESAAVGASSADHPELQPELSERARRLRDLLIQDCGDGLLLRVDYLGGAALIAGGSQIEISSSAREQAQWEAAIEELLERKLIRAQPNGKAYRVTAEAFEM